MSARPVPPKVHIVTPVYNRADLVGETIDSVLEQTFEDWKYTIVDDGSTDETSAVLERYAGDPRIDVIHQENQGVAGAFNTGLDAVDPGAHYLAQLGSDDIWKPDYLERMVEALDSNPKWGLAWCDLEQFGESANGDTYRGDRTPTHGEASRTIPEIFRSTVFVGSGVVCRTEPFREGLRFHPDLRVMEDIHIWADIARDWDIGWVDAPLVRYRVHEASLTNASEAVVRNLALTSRSYQLLYERHSEHIPDSLYREKMAEIYHHAADRILRSGGRGLRWSLRALLYRPGSGQTWRNLIKGMLRPGRAQVAPAIEG